MINVSTQNGHRIIKKWFQPYMIIESAKKNFDIIDYTFSGQNKFEMMNNFLEELNKKDTIKFGLYMKNVNKFYLLTLKKGLSQDSDISALENLLLKDRFGSDEIVNDNDWIEITTDTDKAFNMIDLGKAEAAFIMNLEE